MKRLLITVLFILGCMYTLLAQPAPANDDPCVATLLTAQTPGLITGGTDVAGSLANANGEIDAAIDVWYKFVATNQSHMVRITSQGDFEPFVQFYYANTMFPCATILTSSGTCYLGGSLNNTPGTFVCGMSNLIIGETYFFRIQKSTLTSISDSFLVAVLTPENDEPCTAITLTPDSPGSTVCSNPTMGNSFLATTSASIFTSIAGQTSNDVWYKFTATSTSHIIRADGLGAYIPMVTVFDSLGCTPYNFTGIVKGQSTANSSGMNIIHASSLIPGHTYFISVRSAFNPVVATQNFSICVLTPVNDEACTAQNLIPGSVGDSSCLNPYYGSMLLATPTNNYSQNDLWFEFTASAPSHLLKIDGLGNFTPSLNIYEKNSSNITPFPTGCLFAPSNITVYNLISSQSPYYGSGVNYIGVSNLVTGNNYLVRLSKLNPTNNNNTENEFSICILTPTNDDPATATNLIPGMPGDTSTNNAVTGNMFLATSREVSFVTNSIHLTTPEDQLNDVWFKVTATSTSHYIKIAGLSDNLNKPGITLFDSTLASGYAGLYSMLCNNASLPSYLSVPPLMLDADYLGYSDLVPGHTYYIRIMKQFGVTDKFDYTISVLTPLNDEPCTAISLIPGLPGDTVSSFSSTGNTFLSTSRVPFYTGPHSPYSLNMKDTWYKFTASSNSHFVKIKRLSLNRPSCQIYDSVSCSNLSNSNQYQGAYLNYFFFPSNSDSTEYYGIRDLIPGKEYYIRVYHNNPAQSLQNFEISILTSKNDFPATASLVQTCSNITDNARLSTASFIPGICVPPGNARDVWYKFIATNRETSITIDPYITDAALLFGYSFTDSSLESSGTLLGCTGNSSSGGTAQTLVLQNLNPGSTYYIRACITALVTPSQFSGSANEFSLSLSVPPNQAQLSLLSPGICLNENIIFKMSVPYLGNQPEYKWYVNGIHVGPNDSIFNAGMMNNGDQVSGSFTYVTTCNATEILNTILYTTSLNTPTIWYQDADGDGFGNNAVSILSCLQPGGFLADSTDCDDNDSGKHGYFTFYIDNDQDGYGINQTAQACAADSLTPPLGYSLNHTDCDDNNTQAYEEVGFFVDFDEDGYVANLDTVFLCYGIFQSALNPPPGLRSEYLPFLGIDCNDSIYSAFLMEPFYVDADGDGYALNMDTVYVCFSNFPNFQNIAPPGYIRMHISLGIDCNDSDSSMHATYPFYVDADQDGYGTGAPVQVCAINASTPPTGYSLTIDDCNDNDPVIYPGIIDQMEYFVDADPGPGLGIGIPILPTAQDSIAFTANIITQNTIPTGNHLLVIRAHTCGLGWGLFEHRMFSITPGDIYTGPVESGEYFIDADPGVNNGIPFTFPASDTVNQTLAFSIPSNTAPGNHLIGIRVRDSLGNWGHFETKLILVLPPPEPSYPIVAAEYFIDTDPGVGNATPLNVSQADTILQSFNVPLPVNISEGIHLLAVRAKNSNGEWGLFEYRSFYVYPSEPNSNSIVAAEYFIDTDPGLGNATAYPVAALDTLLDTLNISLPNNLSYGLHRIAIRVKDQSGQWSLFEQQQFNYKEPPTLLPGSGHAITLDGNDDYIQLPPILNGAQQFTIDFWIKTSENRSNGTFWQKPTIIGNANPSAPDGDFGITTDNGQLGVWSGFCCGDQSMQTSTSIKDNQWHHVAAVNNGSNLVLYVDGILLPGSIPTNGGAVQNAIYPWRIGMNNSCCSGGSPHAGTVDEFRFWNTALSETQIRERMCRKITDSDPLYNNMTAYFNFDETGSSNAIDGSNQSNIGILQNGANRILSGAPIGNTSAYAYNGSSSTVNLTHPTRGDQIDASVSSGSAVGLQVYCVTERPNTQNGIDTLTDNDAYYGVFAVNGNTAQLNVTHNYSGVQNITNENGLNLYQRDRNDNSPWSNSSAAPNTNTNTLSTNTTYRQEYMLGMIQPSYATLNVKAFIQGFYEDNEQMRSVLNNQGQSNPTTDADTVQVNLHEANSPYNMAHTFTGILQTDGTITCTYPSSVSGQLYYIALKHRNSVETWSAAPVLLSPVSIYDFSTSATQAYGSNMIQVDNAPAIFAVYSGDIDQSGGIDGDDFNLLDPDIQTGNGGYLPTDLDGSGGVDGDDFNIFDPNVQVGVGIYLP
ncbi:MAG: LamG domain-containing protein [Chitinophagaceae bacterium]|nr:LamG domain-containing protein [Chitinophagaceae bacterium]